MATLDQAIDQMYAAGMPQLPNGTAIADGKLHRYGPKGYHRWHGRSWYKLYEYVARNGRRYVAGIFGRHGEIDLTKIRTDWSGIEPDEHQRLQRSRTQQEVREREKREHRANFAANRALSQWQAGRARLSEGEACAYLVQKRLQWEKGLRALADGTLLVPMVRYDVPEDAPADGSAQRRLVGLQKIAPDGTKLFNRGVATQQGEMCRFGKKPKDGDLLLVGEGLATVLAAHQVLERAYTSFVAFSAGNLAPAAKILRALYPASPILFLADDDAYLEAQLNARLAGDYEVRELYKVLDAERVLKGKTGPLTVHATLHEDARGVPLLTAGITQGERLRTLILTNTGRTKAWEAAGAIGNAWVAWPKFAERSLAIDPAAPRLTDFNDLLVAESAERLVELLAEELKLIEDARELARGLAAGVPRDRGGEGKGASGGGGKGDDDEPDWAVHGSLLRRFTLIERSELAFDAAQGFLWRIPHMRYKFGNRSIGMWLGSPRRRSVDIERVVFDPVGAEDPAKTVNLFRGLEMKPVGGTCEKLLELLRYLCGENPEDTYTPVSDWVLRWAAYAVQHVGAKMRTAIVMYGPERTGKNLFWGALRAIYGKYGGIVTQAELESQYNTWMSAKLFIIANEVVTRAEMSHQVGRLKHMVTEDEMGISQKYADLRYERNHVNLVFLSNEFLPLKISPGDERYMVIRTPGKREKEFYRAVGAELKAGGAQALMRYLLALDVGDFNEYTVPLETAGKEAVIEAGMFPSQLFWRELHDGLLGLPYCPALTQDVFRAYVAWCHRNGHKMPESFNRFTPNFMSLNGVRRLERRVPDPGKPGEIALAGTTAEHQLRMRRVFLMGEPKADANEENQRIVQGIAAFRKALGDYLSEDSGGGYGWQAGGDRSRGRQEEAF